MTLHPSGFACRTSRRLPPKSRSSPLLLLLASLPLSRLPPTGCARALPLHRRGRGRSPAPMRRGRVTPGVREAQVGVAAGDAAAPATVPPPAAAPGPVAADAAACPTHRRGDPGTPRSTAAAAGVAGVGASAARQLPPATFEKAHARDSSRSAASCSKRAAADRLDSAGDGMRGPGGSRADRHEAMAPFWLGACG
eukprot:151325-Chlamydomonas_euryale.AAC.5